jgi:hypothetical protein
MSLERLQTDFRYPVVVGDLGVLDRNMRSGTCCRHQHPQPPDASASSSAKPLWERAMESLLSLVGAGTIGGLIIWMLNARQERRRRRIEFLDSQLRNLYGPLQFFVSGSQDIYKHVWSIEQAAHEEYGGEKASKQPRPTVSEGIQATLEVNNEYFAITDENSRRMVEILTNNYALIEPDDAETFARFRVHHLRHKTEFDASRRLKLPYEVYTHVGDIYNLPPEFADVVNRRFRDKKAELERLSR